MEKKGEIEKYSLDFSKSKLLAIGRDAKRPQVSRTRGRQCLRVA